MKKVQNKTIKCIKSIKQTKLFKFKFIYENERKRMTKRKQKKKKEGEGKKSHPLRMQHNRKFSCLKPRKDKKKINLYLK